MAVLQKKAYSVSIIILNYHTEELILSLLKLLGTDENIEIIIVDNSPETLLKNLLIERSDIIYKPMEKNVGFSAGNNYGIKIAKGEWICLLNSDIEATMDDIKKWLDETIRKNYLVSTPQLRGTNKKLQNNTGHFSSFIKNPINYTFLRPTFLDSSRSNIPEADLAIGAALLVHTSVFDKVGNFDDSHYFMYFEDIDWCYSLHKKNIPILRITDVTLLHYGGSSSDQNIAQKNKNYATSLNNYLLKNRGWIIMKLYSFFNFLR